MECDDKYFINPDGLKLLNHIWYPENVKPGEKFQALVFIVHGLSEHALFYYEDTIVLPLLNLGCLVVAHDHIGHGGSEGDRRLVQNVDNLVRDVISHLDYLIGDKYSNQLHEVPIFLYGHSLGGLVTCKVVLKRPQLIQGMVLEAPALEVGEHKSKTYSLRLTVATVVACLKPTYILRGPATIAQMLQRLTNNSEVAIKASKDPLRNQGGLAIATAVNVARATNDVRLKLSKIDIPFLTGHGGRDPIVPLSASTLLHSKSPSKDKTLIIYDNELHILRAEPQCDFRHRVVDWISNHINSFFSHSTDDQELPICQSVINIA